VKTIRYVIKMVVREMDLLLCYQYKNTNFWDHQEQSVSLNRFISSDGPWTRSKVWSKILYLIFLFYYNYIVFDVQYIFSSLSKLK